MKKKYYPIVFNWSYAKLLVVSVIFLVNATFAKAQNTFEKMYGGPLQESARSLAVLSDGFLILGHTTSHSAGTDTNVYIIRTNMNGDTLWTKMFGSSTQHDVGYTIAATKDGNFIIAGSTGNSPTTNSDAWLVKIDPSAKILWSKTKGSYGTEVAFDVQETSDNGFIVTGYADVGGSDSVNAFLWRTDANGADTWYYTYGGNRNDEGHSVKQTPEGDFIFIGQTMSMGAGDLDFYVVKTGPTGAVLWTKTYGGAYYDRGQDLEIIADGYILTGDTKKQAGGEDYDAYLVKINNSGEVQWFKTFGGTDKDITKMIRKTNDGGYIIVGNIRSYGYINPYMWIIKTDANGVEQWTQHYGFEHHEHGYFIEQLADGGYIVLGHTVRYYTPDYNVDIYLVKINAQGTLTTGTVELSENSNISIYPNPNTGIFEIQYETETNAPLEVLLSDMTGRVIYKETATILNNHYKKNMDVSSMPKGIYFLSLINNDGHFTRKVVVD